MGAGLKYNLQTVIENRQVGYSGNARIKIRGLGDIEFVLQKVLYPV